MGHRLKNDWIPAVADLLTPLIGDSTGAVGPLIRKVQSCLPGRTDAEIARAFWESALILALVRSLDEDGIGRVVTGAEAANVATATLAPILAKIPEAPADPGRGANPDLEYDRLVAPTTHPAYEALREAFPAFVTQVHPECRLPEETLQGRLDRALSRALHRVWVDENTAAFRAAVERHTSGPTAEGLKRWRAWQRHYGWIETPLDRQPLLLQPEDSPITLRAIYTPLRCAWHEDGPVASDAPARRWPGTDGDGRPGAAPPHRIAHIGWLEEAVRAWLEDGDNGDAVRVVVGGPGSGKTSFARLLASAIGREGEWNVAFVPLQHLAPGGELEDRLLAHFGTVNDSMGLGGNPLAWQDIDMRPILLVLDGLDELARGEEDAARLAAATVAQARRLADRRNSLAVRIKVLILGRFAAVADAVDKDHLPRAALLHALPLGPLDERALAVGPRRHRQDPAKEDVRDLSKLVGIDQRRDYWERWCRASGERRPLADHLLEQDTLRELTLEPLLFYFLIVSGRATGDPDQPADRNSVYEEIFREVHRRDRDKPHAESQGQDEKTFFEAMECLSLAVWHGGGRTGGDEDFRRLGECYVGGRWRQMGAGRHSVRSAAVQFYTRAEFSRDNPGFEFLHKSFGEYLIGRTLLRAACRWQEKSAPDFAAKWAELAGSPVLTDEIVDFLRGEARHFVADDRERAVALKVRLVEAFSWALEHGFPTHNSVEFWKETERRQRNAMGTLLAVLNGLALALAATRTDESATPDACLRIAWPDRQAPRRLIEFLHITGGGPTPHRRLLGHLDLHDLDLSGVDLNGVDLSGADLRETNLREVSLRNVNLRGANLKGANLCDATLSRAKLCGADLSRANLLRADLFEVELCEATLSKGNLRWVDLSGADLSVADLTMVDLSEADLRGAQLSGADLYNATLFEANLFEANLSEADLTMVDMRRVDLTMADLSDAKLIEADLCGANLTETNLVEANMTRANLSGVDLQGLVFVNEFTGMEDLLRRGGHGLEIFSDEIPQETSADPDWPLRPMVTQAQCDTAFGDGGTRLPEGVQRPGHWSEANLNTIDARAAWRAWLASG